MKHIPLIISASDLTNLWQGNTDDAPTDYPDDVDRRFYVVLWPGHVISPRFNNDCIPHGPMELEEARSYQDDAEEFRNY